MNETQKCRVWYRRLPEPRRSQLRHDLAPVSNQYLVAPADGPEILTQAILELPDPYGAHGANVASCSYIVNQERKAFCNQHVTALRTAHGLRLVPRTRCYARSTNAIVGYSFGRHTYYLP